MGRNLTFGGGKGAHPEPNRRMVFNRTGGSLAKGSVVQADHTLSQAETTQGINPGQDDHTHSNGIDPATAFLATGDFAVYLEQAPDDKAKMVHWTGYTQVLVDNGAAGAVGATVFAANGQSFLEVGAPGSGERVLGTLQEAIDGSGGTVLAWVDFDGMR